MSATQKRGVTWPSVSQSGTSQKRWLISCFLVALFTIKEDGLFKTNTVKCKSCTLRARFDSPSSCLSIWEQKCIKKAPGSVPLTSWYWSYISQRKLFQYNAFYLVTKVVKALIRLWAFRYWSRAFIELNIHNQFIIIFGGITDELHFVLDKLTSLKVSLASIEVYTKLKKPWQFRNVSRKR